jgi:cell division protein FtsB
MDNGNPTLWEMVKDFFVPVGGPAVGGLLGYLAARQKNQILDDHLDAKGDAIQLDAITRHFEALIDGYEKRINDLTSEVHQLRDEVKKLRQALDARSRAGL